MKKIKPIIFGSTGMVGEGVLHECLKHSDVEAVLVINRRTCGVKNEKLRELIHQDFFNLSDIESELVGYNACYFCMGVSSFRKKEADYRRVTYDLTLHVAGTLLKQNPDMIFCYVSGAETDSTKSGRSMWARVKGKTENDLMRLSFQSSYMFRPGYIQPTKGLKNTYKVYKILVPFYPILKTLFPKYVCTLEDLGKAMINVVLIGSDSQILENKDITRLAQHKPYSKK